MITDGQTAEYLRQLNGIDEGDMSEAKTFKDKVDTALKEIMSHSVAGHPTDRVNSLGQGSTYHVYCNNSDHALHILAEHGLTLMNAHVAAHILDNQ